MVSRLIVRNFRSLESLQLDLAPLTALVGPNGSGKSAILRAINLVLGDRYPTLNALRLPYDFTAGDESRHLVVRIRLKEPVIHEDKMRKDHEVFGFEVSCKPYVRRTGRAEPGDPNFDFVPLDTNGEPPTVALSMGKGGPNFGPLTHVPNALRDEARALFIDHRRSVTQHQPWARGSILARLLGPARKELGEVEFAGGRSHAKEFSARYQAAMEALRTPRVQEIERLISETTRSTLSFLGAGTLEDLKIEFGFSDPANPFGTVRLNYLERGLLLPAEELGSGIQSAIVIGIFEAFRQLGTSIGTVLIEEPEMFLHPQAQRYLHGLLTHLVEQGLAQVIYSTHSAAFADLRRFESIRLVRREPGAMTAVSAATKEEDVAYLNDRRERRKLESARGLGEVLFARRVLLVEGPGDAIAASMAAERVGLDLDAEDYSVVACGSKASIPFVARLCRALEIPITILHDTDFRELPVEEEAQRKKVEEENAEAARLNDAIGEAVGDEGRIFRIEPSLEEALGIGRNASDKPQRVADALAGLDYNSWPEALREAVAQLNE